MDYAVPIEEGASTWSSGLKQNNLSSRTRKSISQNGINELLSNYYEVVAKFKVKIGIYEDNGSRVIITIMVIWI